SSAVSEAEPRVQCVPRQSLGTRTKGLRGVRGKPLNPGHCTEGPDGCSTRPPSSSCLPCPLPPQSDYTPGESHAHPPQVRWHPHCWRLCLAAGTGGADRAQAETGAGVARVNQREAFLQAILDDPGDDAVRLVFADWLEEHDDPLGEFIRVQMQLDEMPDDDPA